MTEEQQTILTIKEKLEAIEGDHKRLSNAIQQANQLLCSACEIARRKGDDTHWDRFLASCEQYLARQNMRGVSARTYRILPGELGQKPD